MKDERKRPGKPRQVAMVLASAIAVAALTTSASGCADGYHPREGDLVFHESKSAQSRLIQKATNSRYSHVGIVHIEDGEPFVLEAITTVQSTPLDEWIERGVDGHIVVMRLKPEALPSGGVAAERVRRAAEPMIGVEYDWWFQWSNDRMYCSELVWKILRDGLGIEVGSRQSLGAFELDDPEIAAEIEKRFGGEPHFDEPIVSPVAMLESELLIEVYRN